MENHTWDDDTLASPVEFVTSTNWPDHQQYIDVVNHISEDVDHELAEMERYGDITHDEHELLLFRWRQAYLNETPPAA